MRKFQLVAKFVACELLAPFFGTLGIILLLPILFPIVVVELGWMKLIEAWDEFKRTEAAAASRATDGVREDLKR